MKTRDMWAQVMRPSIESQLLEHRREMHALEDANDAHYSDYIAPDPYWDWLWELEDLAFEENKGWLVPTWDEYLRVLGELHLKDPPGLFGTYSKDLSQIVNGVQRCPARIFVQHSGEVHCATDEAGQARIHELLQRPNIKRMIDLFDMHDL